jgi:hypothetical protein
MGSAVACRWLADIITHEPFLLRPLLHALCARTRLENVIIYRVWTQPLDSVRLADCLSGDWLHHIYPLQVSNMQTGRAATLNWIVISNLFLDVRLSKTSACFNTPKLRSCRAKTSPQRGAYTAVSPIRVLILDSPHNICSG